MSAGTLETRLRELNLDDLEQGSIELENLLVEMLKQIGSTDPVLRDELIYQTFCNLVMSDVLRDEQMTAMMTTCLDEEHLFLRIGEGEGDAVFKRSFSVLVVALLVHKDRQAPFLSSDLFDRAMESVFLYLQKEKDIRGYVNGKGWAHSIAHGADALDEIIRHPSFRIKMLDRCLESIQVCLLKEGVYSDDEDERLLMAVEGLLTRGLADYDLANWVKQLDDKLSCSFDEEGFSVAFSHTKQNVLTFLKSGYFRVKFNHDAKETMAAIEDVLEKWMKKFYG